MSETKNIVRVSSLPLKDFALCFAAPLHMSCSEYYVNLPDHIGEGEIRGLNFDNGLGLIIYRCTFKEDYEVQFTVDDIHPLKYLYMVDGPIEHEFLIDKETHLLEKYKCAMVASRDNGGHILRFKAGESSYLVSLEIDRATFTDNLGCELDELSTAMKELLQDKIANKAFYHEGYYGLSFLNLFHSINDFEDKKLVRKLFLESKSLDIFVNQIELFEDDNRNPDKSKIFRTNEISVIEKAGAYIFENLGEDLKVSDIASIFGLNETKLQQGFKYFYNHSVKEYIIQKRLEEASLLIRTTNLSISEISDKVGFRNKSHFSKSFKNYFKLGPKEFRGS